MKPRTIDTLRALVRDLKMDALHSGRYPIPVDPDKWEQRDKSRAFRCMAYVSYVRRINALEDAIKALARPSIIDRWRGDHEDDAGHYAVLAGFEAALRKRDDALADWYDAADIDVQLALFSFVTDLLQGG